MHPVSITQAFLLGLLAVAPLVFGAPVGDQGLAKRDVGMRDVPPPDEFGAWERRAVPPPDEFGSWDKREAELEVRHHTDAQIAAKAAKAAKAAAAATSNSSSSGKRDVPPPDEFGSWDKREAELEVRHHTDAQIAAKAAKAAKAAAAATSSSSSSGKRDVPPPDEFGSWDKREAELEVRHHTDAQIAAKAKAAAAAGSGSACPSKRSPHHTDAQIAAKKAAAAASSGAAAAASNGTTVAAGASNGTATAVAATTSSSACA